MSAIKKSLSRYTSDWSARIEFLKKSLDTETQFRDRVSGERAVRENLERDLEQETRQAQILLIEMKKLEENAQILAEQVKRVQETSAHEVRQVSRRCQELEEFVKAKEIDLQNLKSESVEHRLIVQEIKEKIELQAKKWDQAREEIEKNVQDLTELISSLKVQIASEEKSVKEVLKKAEGQEAGGQETAAPPAETLQAPIVVLPEEEPIFKRWLEWWNEPVTKISIPKKGSD